MRPWFILAAVALARIGFGYEFQAVGALGPLLVPLFHLSYAAFGSLIGAYMLFGLFVALPLGLLGRWLGDRPVFGCGLGLMVLGAAFDAAAFGPSGIALGRAIGGVGAVAMTVLQGKIIADFFTGRRLMIGMSVSSCTFPIGLGLAQLILPPTAQAFGWQAALLTEAVAPALALTVFLIFYRQPASVAAQSRRLTWPSRHECLLLAVAGGIWTVYTSGYFAYLSYVPSALAARGDSARMIGLVSIIATWGNVPATMLGGWLAARYGGLPIFLIASAGVAIGMTGTVLTEGAVWFAFLVGVVGSIHPGVIMVIGTLSARPENRAVGMGLFYSIYYLGGSISPALCGYVADRMGGPAGGVLAGAVLSATAVPLFLLHRKLARHDTMLARA